MTIEHKILTLVDRGVTWERDLMALTGPGVGAYLGTFECSGLAIWIGEHVSLTPAGLERLNELDDA